MLFYQPMEGYRFNSDSLFLYDFASNFSPKGSLLDVGCGVGVIGLLLARDFPLSLTMVEKQAKMADFAKKNIRVNDIRATLVQKDFLDISEKETGVFDFIVSNPPFYHENVMQSSDSHIHACRYNTHLPIESFCKKSASLLKPRGHFIFCYDASQLPQIAAALKEAKLRMENIRFVHSKISRPAKLVMVQARKDSRAQTKVWPPLISFDGDVQSDEVEAIYQKARTHTIKCQI
ncbi:tRNA1(Val) (adenine(37)-N6)-methyltransferase [Hydrogenimonas sp.]